jgi:hypothetical protein
MTTVTFVKTGTQNNLQKERLTIPSAWNDTPISSSSPQPPTPPWNNSPLEIPMEEKLEEFLPIWAFEHVSLESFHIWELQLSIVLLLFG